MEGGIAAKTFWLVRALARAGHTIHVVTDPVDVDAVYSIPGSDRPPDTPSVIVHRADQDVPWHIPNDNHRTISILDKTLAVISQNKPDLIVGGYLIPYGVVAFQAGLITGIPYVLLHGGSDINKFLQKNVWPNIIPKALVAARLIISDADNHVHIRRFTDRVRILPPYVPNPAAFFLRLRREHKEFTLALIGKANYHWRHKGWQQVVNLWCALGKEFKLLVVSQGIGLDDFKGSVPKGVRDRITWQSFVPPWKMPALLQAVDGVFHLHNQLPFPTFSNLVLESLSCGATVITDSPGMPSSHRRHGIDLGVASAAIFQLLSDDSQAVAIDLAEHLAKRDDNIPSWDCAPDFNRYVASIDEFLNAI